VIIKNSLIRGTLKRRRRTIENPTSSVVSMVSTRLKKMPLIENVLK
tara:strand:+ start:902 stop:1039 length:138 start_codon:yes stop_codon:yes gene_type:complete